MAATNRVAAHLGDHRLGDIADHALQFLQRQANYATSIIVTFMGGLIATGAKGFFTSAG